MPFNGSKAQRDGLQICLFCKNSCLEPNEDDGAVYTIGAENERNLRYFKIVI